MKELVVHRVSRRYGAVLALDDVSMTFASGGVHALMGENGAGKSTLIRLLAGLEAPDEGHFSINGQTMDRLDPGAVRDAGLRFIHQELHAVNGLSIAENMHLDHPYPTRAGLVRWRALNRSAAEALEHLDLSHLNPRAPMSDLSLGDQMLVRIAATLIDTGGAPPWLYVMDEPTAALTNEEAERLFSVIGGLIRNGAGVVYVSHRMPEVMSLADRVTVLRDGKSVASRTRSESDERTLIEDMTGRDVSHLFPPRRPVDVSAPKVLEVQDIRSGLIKRADVSVKAGEILGVAGLAGSGRGELLRALIGDTPLESGAISLDGSPLPRAVSDRWKAGLAYVPRERRAQGLMLDRSVIENITLPHLTNLARMAVFLDHGKQRRVAGKLSEDARVKATSTAQSCAKLSGGNQQKVLFARAIAGKPKVLLLDEPTRGVDVGAKSELYRLIRDFSDRGLAVIIASSDLPELLGLAHRIAIMRDGELAEIVDANGLSEADLLARFYHRTNHPVAA